MPIDLDTKQLEWITQQCRKHLPKAKVFVFGSRISGKARPFSDLDLAIDNNEALSLAQLSKLEECFADSDLPILIDLVDWHRITPEFQQHILNHSEVLIDPSA